MHLQQRIKGMRQHACKVPIFLSVRQACALGADGVWVQIPKNENHYITIDIDIDSFDPSIASGTDTPNYGGFLYDVMKIMQGLAKQGNVVGINLCAVAPLYGHSKMTSNLAAHGLLNLLGYIKTLLTVTRRLIQ